MPQLNRPSVVERIDFDRRSVSIAGAVEEKVAPTASEAICSGDARFYVPALAGPILSQWKHPHARIQSVRRLVQVFVAPKILDTSFARQFSDARWQWIGL